MSQSASRETVALPVLPQAVPRIAHHVPHGHRLEHDDLGLHLHRHLEVRAVAAVRPRAVHLAGRVDRRHHETAHQLTGQRLESDEPGETLRKRLHRPDHLE